MKRWNHHCEHDESGMPFSIMHEDERGVYVRHDDAHTEINRLRAALQKIADARGPGMSGYMVDAAMQALSTPSTHQRVWTGSGHLEHTGYIDKEGDPIDRARAAWGGKWPAQLTSGVMFFEGCRITREQFESQQ